MTEPFKLIQGDCIEVMAQMEPTSVDAVVCDPPYMLSFMNQTWDKPSDTRQPFRGEIQRPDNPYGRSTVRYGGSPSYGVKDWRSGTGYSPLGVGGHSETSSCGATSANPTCAACHGRMRGDKLCQCEIPDWHVQGEPWDPHEVQKSYASSMQEWHYRWAREAFRVLKPGAFLLAAGGTRTYHRLACAVEDAGLEIRDCIEYISGDTRPFPTTLLWIYGCLSADTEILTTDGWKLGVDVVEGEHVAQWDPTTEAVTCVPVERKILAPWNGPMRALKNSDTDQLITPNHRVWHRTMCRGVRSVTCQDGWMVTEAAQLTRYAATRLPLSGLHDGPGIGSDDYAALLGWVWTEGGFDHAPSTGVRIYQSSSANSAKVKEIDGLLGRLGIMAKRYERERTYRYKDTERQYTEVCWLFTGEWARRIRSDLPGKHPDWALLWRMKQSEKQALYEAAMAGDGSGNAFDQKDRADLEWFATLLHLMGKRGRVTMRKNRDTGAVAIARLGRTEMQSRHFKAAPDEHYEGMVWCVTVPRGAFLARRNGKVFVTGNSGFPKSKNVALGIDKGEGHPNRGKAIPTASTYQASDVDQENKLTSNPVSSYEAQSEDAKKWDGWGSALKPSFEPIVVARKPLIGTLVANVLQYGTGALNIDACRVGYGSENVDLDSVQRQQHSDGTIEGAFGAAGLVGSEIPTYKPGGRFPANVILGHADGCKKIGSVPEPGYTINRFDDGAKPFGDGAGHEYTSTETESIERDVYECVKGCAVRELDEQSGQTGNGWKRNYGRMPTRVEQVVTSNRSPQAEKARKAPIGVTRKKGVTDFALTPGPRGGAPEGRFPSNVILAHSSTCRVVGTRKVKNGDPLRFQSTDGGWTQPYGNQVANQPAVEEIPAYECVEGCPVRTLDEQSGPAGSNGMSSARSDGSIASGNWGFGNKVVNDSTRTYDTKAQGGASRFFEQIEQNLADDHGFLYTAKASRAEREEGLGRLVPQVANEGTTSRLNRHPTVKPVALMRYLVRLVTPPGGTVLDPFAGSGTTLVAAIREGFNVIGIEREEEYVSIARARAEHAWRSLAEQESLF